VFLTLTGNPADEAAAEVDAVEEGSRV